MEKIYNINSIKKKNFKPCSGLFVLTNLSLIEMFLKIFYLRAASAVLYFFYKKFVGIKVFFIDLI